MNKAKKKSQGLNWAEITLLVIAAVVLMTAGFTHAWIKNCQVEIVRAVDSAQRRISDHDDSINSLQVKIDKKLNIYQLRDDLERGGSELTTVPVSAIEKITPYSSSQPSVVSTAVASRQP